MHRLTVHSLSFKIGAAIILGQVLAMGILGAYYIERFSQQVDQRIQTQIQTPGALMNAGSLSYGAVDDSNKMRTLIGGNQVKDAVLIGADRTIFHSSNAQFIGRNIQYEVPNFDPDWLSTQHVSQKGEDKNGNYLISVTPIYSGAGAKTPFLFLYLKVGTNAIESQKAFIKWLFILGSLVSLVLTTLVVTISFYLVIFQRMRKLVHLSQLISRGRLTEAQAVPLVASKDELGDLAMSFRQMIYDLIQSQNKLKEYAQGLEQKVQERTGELNQKVKELETEKNVAERAQAKDEAIISSIGEGVIATDNAGNVLLVNHVAESMLGLQPGSHTGQPMTSLFTLTEESGEAVAPAAQPVYGALHQGQKVTKNFSYATPDGRTITLGITSAPVIQTDTQGRSNIVGTINILRDITHEKEVDRMKTEFISLASHQLRTPLSAIKWFSEMLVNGDAGKLTADQTDFAKNIVDSTERMIDLVNSLLNISRIESGRIMIDPKPTDLKEMIDTLAKELEVKIKERNQTLIVSVHEDLPLVNLDPRLIRQVYLNLLTNAIKYTPKGGEISVFISRKGDELLSQVTDNGYGIPKAEQGKMFQKFFRATNITKVETDGTGLGMYLIKAVIEASHGRIWFESEEGKGTTFRFSLPMSGMEAKKGEVTLEG
jgi:PAS domain S-box-containing protein